MNINKDISKIALLCCSNGMGHCRRQYIQALEFQNNGYHVTLFGSLKKIHALELIYGKKIKRKINFITFDYKNFRQGEIFKRWPKSIINSNKYEIVISDNLVEVLLYRPDAYLMGSFFWHYSIKNYESKFKSNFQLLNKLIKDIKPTLFSPSFFTPEYMRDLCNHKSIGLHCLKKGTKFPKKKDLLVCCGLGGDCEDIYIKIIKNLINIKKKFFENIWIEPKLYNSSFPEYIKPATFTEEMYSTTLLAICRPGIGTISECIQHKIFSLLIYEDNNMEMKFIDKKLVEGESAYSCKNITDLFEKLYYFLDNTDKITNNLYKDSHFKLSGSKDVIEQLIFSKNIKFLKD